MVTQVLRLSNPNLTRACQRFLVVLAHHYNDHTGLCCPGHRLLARELLVSERQVKRLVHDAAKAGFLDVLPGQGRGHLSTFRLKVPPPEVIHRKGDISRNDAAGKGDIFGPEGPRKGDILGCAPIKVVEQEREKTEQDDARALVLRSREADAADFARTYDAYNRQFGWRT